MATKNEEMWRKAAVRLARAIVRFSNNNNLNHTDSTISYALSIIRKSK
jgi:hypothetical protein